MKPLIAHIKNHFVNFIQFQKDFHGDPNNPGPINASLFSLYFIMIFCTFVLAYIFLPKISLSKFQRGFMLYPVFLIISNLIRCLVRLLCSSHKIILFSEKLVFIIYIPFYFTWWMLNLFFKRIHVDILTPLLPFVISSYFLYAGLGLKIIQLIISHFAEPMRTFIKYYNNPDFTEVSCIRIIVSVVIIVMIVFHNSTCLFIFEKHIQHKKVPGTLNEWKQGLNQFNCLALIITTAILYIPDFSGIEATLVDIISNLTTLGSLYTGLLSFKPSHN